MAFNDDEPIISVPNINSGRPKIPARGRVKYTAINKKQAPLEETEFKALLKFEGENAFNDRPGVDIIAVLDVSGSMQGEKIDKLKTAMQFFIRKLGSIDRLSIVTFAKGSNRLCPLRQINNDSQSDIERIIKGLVANGGTNIKAGLETALEVLKDRRLFEGRVSAVMLMSDGDQNEGDARTVDVSKVPVHTFGFGKDFDATVLNAIAKKSNGGTFSIANVDDLSKAFSQCLGGLLSVVVDDLKVIILPTPSRVDGHKPTIKTVAAGNYPQTTDAKTGSVTVSFGTLYAKEVRKIVVVFLLPEVSARTTTSFEVTFPYIAVGNSNTVIGSPNKTSIVRSATARADEPEPEELVTEDARLKATDNMKIARVLADGNKLNDAKEKLVEVQSALDDVQVEEEPSIQMIDALIAEVRMYKKLMRTPEIYKAQGRAFALASETCHERQRFASRGDDDNLRLFATPRMDAYLEQAKAFDADPEKAIPSADQDVEEEIAKDPLGPIVGSLGTYLQTAIEALQSIQEILNATRS